MHKLLAKQIANSTDAAGEVDTKTLAELVSAAYEELDRDRRRTDRSIELMVAEVEASQKRLLDAIDVVPEGFVLFDAEDRYVLWNKRYEELYAENRHLLAVGKRFEDVLRTGPAWRSLPEAQGREEEWIAERLARHNQPQNSEVQRLPGDRWVRVEERRTADGGSIGVRIDITEQTQREKSFQMMFESNPVPMCVVGLEDLKFRAVNEAALKHYGYGRDQLLNMTVLETLPAESWKDALKMAQSGAQKGQIWQQLKADGSLIDVSLYYKRLTYQGRAAALVAAIDCTEALRAEKDLRSTRQFLDTVIENMPAPIIVKNASDFRYVLINQAAEQFFGISRDRLIGKTAEEMFPAVTASIISEHDRQLLESRGKLFFDELSMETPGNGTRQIRSTRLAIPEPNGEPKYLLGVLDDVTDTKRAEARIAHMAQHDTLTDLPNRAAFNEKFELILERSAAANESFALMSFDLDRFKEINDLFGHSVGDILLCEVSRRLQGAVEGAFLARLGGDEFAVIAADHFKPEAVSMLADELLRAMTEEYVIEGNHIRVNVSIGVAIYPMDGGDRTTLLNNADAALYRAKADGRGTVRFFQADMDKRLREQRALLRDLGSAAERGEFVLHFQPQTMIGGEVIGFEALVRWIHPSQGMVPPGIFIPIAEESGLILPIGEWVLREACREAASWPKPLQIAVNLSPVQFRHGDLPALIHSILLETGLQPDRLELEITESVLIDNFSKGTSILRRLKSLGVRIAMDDFGTGYSSLSYLQSFPFDKIKIDKSFISNVERNAQSATIVRAVIGLAKGLGLPVLAEGVETKEQLEFLIEEACNEVQGYFIGRPYPIEQYVELIGRAAAAHRKSLVA